MIIIIDHQIAHLCDTLLSGMKGVVDRTIVGNPRNCLTLGGTVGQLCIISRTNYCQFVEAAQATDPEKTVYWDCKENGDNNNNNGGNNMSNKRSKATGKGKGKNGSLGTRPTVAFAGQDKEDFLLKVCDYDLF